MTRNYVSLALIFAVSLAGCAKNTPDSTQNPDTVANDGDGDGQTDGASTPSRARGTTSTHGSKGGTKARKVTAKKPARVNPPKPDNTETGPNGLLAEAFTLKGSDKLPEDFAALGAAVETFTVPNLDIDEVDFTNGFPGAKALKDNYAIRFSGSINIVEEAEYELCLHSDDGSQLLLEGTLVVDNDGVLEAPAESCELVYLAAGEYMLEIRYFQVSGPLLALHMAWAINGGDKVIVPTDVLFKPATAG
jgi:hypothetical protein